MNVGELINVLSEFNPELEVIYEQCSDFSLLEECDIRVEKAVFKGGYVERFYAYQYKDTPPDLREYLCFPGN